jgi:hypothetical protein
MFTVTGRVLKTFVQQGGIDKDSGKPFDDSFKVQIMGELPLQGGQSRFDVITMTVEDRQLYDSLENKTIRVPLGFFSPARGQILYFIPKGSNPEIVEEGLKIASTPVSGFSSSIVPNNSKNA